MTFRRAEYLGATTVALLAFGFYCATLSTTVDFIDSGELAADVYTLGIAHPTGYPLFTLFGYLFTHLPLGLRVITQANLMSALLCAAGLFFFFRFLLFALSVTEQGGFARPRDPLDKIGPEDLSCVILPSFFGASILAFSETYWSQALSIEVYSLHVCFLSIVLFLFAKSIVIDIRSRRTKGSAEKGRGSWPLFAFFLGLAFTNHMTTILLAPAFLVGFFWVNRFGEPATWRKLRVQVLPFILGLSVYLYLPVRASMKPLLNWGNPSDVEKFLWHISGKVYRVWIFSSFESSGKQFRYFVDSLPAEFAVVPLLLAGAGVWHLLRTNRSLLVFTLLLFLGCIGYSINYDIHDIDSYFILAYVTIAFWAGFGILALASVSKSWRTPALAGGLIVVIVMIAANHSRVDERDATIVEDYTKDMLKSLDSNAVIVSYQWDYFVSASYYFQLVENVRPDVVVIDKELLRRTWYFEQLERRYPWLVQASRSEIEAFKSELYKFEHGIPYNASAIENRYSRVIASILARSASDRPVYVTPEIEPQYYQGFVKVPSGLAFRLFRQGSDSIPLPKPPEYSFRIPSRRGMYVDGILTFYAQSYLNYSIFMNLQGDRVAAEAYVARSLDVKPDYSEAIQWRARLGSVR